jgi:shikimate kinase
MGLRGSGKTTVAKLVGEQLGREWIDLDDLTPSLMGFDAVAEAWRAKGEQAFRAAEVKALASLLDQPDPPGLIALGGGTPTVSGAAARLESERSRGKALLFYLRAPADVLRERLRRADNSGRPPLTGPAADMLEEIDRVLAERDPLYCRLADHIIETEAFTPAQIAERVIAVVKPTSR